MKDKLAVKRYAESFVSFALPKIGLPRVIEDMRILRIILRENPELDHFLTVPDVPYHDKTGVIDRVLTRVLTLETCDFIKYLITKLRINLLMEITNYVRLVYSHGEVVDAILRTTYPLELDLVEKIKQALEKRTGKNINLYLELNPDLLGGVQIQIGNMVIDSSLRSKLDDVKKQLLKLQVLR